MGSGIAASLSPGLGLEGTIGVGGILVGGPESLDQIVKGVPIQCLVRVKPNNGYQRDDIKISQNKIGLTDTNGRIREEYNVSEVFTPEASNSTIFNMMFPSYMRALVQGVNVSLF